MCRAVTCKSCGKPTWVGCGEHVEQVLGSVPVEDRCQGHSNDSSGGAGWLRGVLRRP